MKILTYPELLQTCEYDCGANALQSILAYYDVEVGEEILIKKAKTNKKEGTTINGIETVLKNFDLHFDSRKMTIDDVR